MGQTRGASPPAATIGLLGGSRTLRAWGPRERNSSASAWSISPEVSQRPNRVSRPALPATY
eukprot:10494275-Lingulodinium_polyedra.AAC.1